MAFDHADPDTGRRVRRAVEVRRKRLGRRPVRTRRKLLLGQRAKRAARRRSSALLLAIGLRAPEPLGELGIAGTFSIFRVQLQPQHVAEASAIRPSRGRATIGKLYHGHPPRQRSPQRVTTPSCVLSSRPYASRPRTRMLEDTRDVFMFDQHESGYSMDV